MTVRRMIKATVHVLEHAATVFVGFALAILGMGMTFTGVFSVLGMIVLAVGASLIVAGIWAHQTGGP
jgi:hypothetical protein